MSGIVDFLASHGSVRQFCGKEITLEQEKQIIEMAERAPTSSNLHAWSVVSIRDTATKQKLAELTGNQQHVADCALFLVWVADMHRLRSLCDARGYDAQTDTAEAFMVAVVDCTLAAGRALVGAQELGMGGVMVGGIRTNIEEVTTLLKLPTHTTPVMGMSLGWPVEPPKVKPRLPIEGIWFQEQYQTDKISEAVTQYDDTIADLGYLTGREVEPENYPDFDGRYSWSEHTARRMASTKKSPMRPHILPYLHSQGLCKK
jgi:nitroreductase